MEIEFTAENNKRIVDRYKSSLKSAIRTFHGESRAARLVAELHARLTVLEIKIEKSKNKK
jgi:hypothetical protein